MASFKASVIPDSLCAGTSTSGADKAAQSHTAQEQIVHSAASGSRGSPELQQEISAPCCSFPPKSTTTFQFKVVLRLPLGVKYITQQQKINDVL